MPPEVLLQGHAVVECQSPAGARVLRGPRLRAARLQLPSRSRASSGMTIADTEEPLLVAHELTKYYGRQVGCRGVSFALYEGEVLAVVGESGSGKSTLLQLLSAQLQPSAGHVRYRMRDGATRDLAELGDAERRFLFRTDWGYVHQDP